MEESYREIQRQWSEEETERRKEELLLLMQTEAETDEAKEVSQGMRRTRGEWEEPTRLGVEEPERKRRGRRMGGEMRGRRSVWAKKKTNSGRAEVGTVTKSRREFRMPGKKISHRDHLS
jgi:hypothetical protein